MTEEISFHCSQVIINDELIHFQHIQNLVDKPYEKTDSKHFETMKCIEAGDFVKLIFQTGDPTPWNPEIYDIETRENLENKRLKTQVEPAIHYGLIDLLRGWVWLPYRVKGVFKDAIASVHKNHAIKPIYDEKQFFEKIRILEEVKFGVVANHLFNKEDNLSETLTKDLYGYGADYAELTLKYNSPAAPDNFIKIIKSKLSKKYSFAKITVSGRDKNGLEMLFNPEAVSTRITLKVSTDENEMIIEDELFNQLIAKVNNEN